MGLQEELTNFPKKLFVYNIFNLIFSLGFLIYIVITVILLHSYWYMFLVMYYSILLVMRFVVLHIVHKKLKYPHHERHNTYLTLYTVYGVIFLLFILFFIPTFLIDFKVYESYKLNMPIIVFAGYAIIKFLLAIYSFKNDRKMQNILVKVLRNLSLIDSIMTLGIMQTLITTYLLGTTLDTLWIHFITEMSIGGVISIVSIVLGVCMIVEANIKRKKLKQEQHKPEPPEIAMFKKKGF